MPPTHSTEGLDAAQVIRREHPEIAIVVLSAHVDVDHAMELLAGGHAIGYLLKTRVTDVDDFVDTVQRVANGASVVGGCCGIGPEHIAELAATVGPGRRRRQRSSG